MELKPNMYVRTKDGKIFKFVKIENGQYRRTWGSDNKNITTAFELEDIKGEPSYNIIDLIEVGDYVNGELVEYIEVDSYKDYVINSGYWCKQKDIKSIVTKEQFESMSYKVGE